MACVVVSSSRQDTGLRLVYDSWGQLREISCLGSDFGLGRSRQGGGKGSLGRVEVRFRRFSGLKRLTQRAPHLRLSSPMGRGLPRVGWGRGPGEGRGAFPPFQD